MRARATRCMQSCPSIKWHVFAVSACHRTASSTRNAGERTRTSHLHLTCTTCYPTHHTQGVLKKSIGNTDRRMPTSKTSSTLLHRRCARGRRRAHRRRQRAGSKQPSSFRGKRAEESVANREPVHSNDSGLETEVSRVSFGLVNGSTSTSKSCMAV